jgi:hypothetical protein
VLSDSKPGLPPLLGREFMDFGAATPVTQATSGRGPAALFAWLCALWLLVSFTLPGLPGTGDLLFTLTLSGLIWPVLVVWIAAPIAALVISIRRLRAGHYYRACAWLIVPATVIVLYFYGSILGAVTGFWLNKAA